MSYVITGISFFFFSFAALADDAWTIRSVALELGQLAQGGLKEYPLQGKTLPELVTSFAGKVTAVEEDTEFVWNAPEVQETDEFVFGTVSAQAFRNLLFSAVFYMDEDSFALYPVHVRKAIFDRLQKLQSTAVIYSWNPFGDSVCGTSFTTPVLIDPVTQRAYELNFYKFEGC